MVDSTTALEVQLVRCRHDMHVHQMVVGCVRCMPHNALLEHYVAPLVLGAPGARRQHLGKGLLTSSRGISVRMCVSYFSFSRPPAEWC